MIEYDPQLRDKLYSAGFRMHRYIDTQKNHLGCLGLFLTAGFSARMGMERGDEVEALLGFAGMLAMAADYHSWESGQKP